MVAASDPRTPPGSRGSGAVSPLISVDDLAVRIADDRRPILLDVRWTLAGADRGAYEAGHLPGAAFADLDADLAGPPGTGGRHPLPDPERWQQFLRAAGVQDDSAIVVYDESDSSAAARAWWLLRWSGLDDVAVLDGGFRAWVAAGQPVQVGAGPAPRCGSVTVRAGQLPTVDTDRAATLAASPGSVLLDARAAARYRGEIEPVDPVAGHIPSAVNLPFGELLRPDGRFRPAPAIAEALSAVGADQCATVAASCGSGVSACVLVLAGQLAGVDIALYPGSYSQWCALARPVETC